MAYGTLNAGVITPGSGNTLALSVAVTVPTPTATGHATTKAYVDSAAFLSGLVAYRASGISTPAGWSEYTSARGRMIVGLPSGGTDGGTVGTALTNAQDKSKSIAHAHTLGRNFGTTVRYHAAALYGNSGHFTASGADNAGGYSGTELNNLSSGMSSGGTVVTSDILAYIQLLTIKKD